MNTFHAFTSSLFIAVSFSASAHAANHWRCDVVSNLPGPTAPQSQIEMSLEEPLARLTEHPLRPDGSYGSVVTNLSTEKTLSSLEFYKDKCQTESFVHTEIYTFKFRCGDGHGSLVLDMTERRGSYNEQYAPRHVNRTWNFENCQAF